MKVYSCILFTVCRQRPYHVESTGSRPITEVKQRRARLVLGWVTAWEHRVLLATFFFFFFPFLLFFFSFSLFFLSFLVCSPLNPLASVIFFCTFRLFFFLMPVTFSRFSFCFRQCFSFSFLLSFFPFYFYFFNSVFNLHTTAEMTDTVVFGKLFSYFFFAGPLNSPWLI